MEEQDKIWQLFFTPEAAAIIALTGVIIAGLINYIGILTTNFFENGRTKKKREHELLQKAYFGSLDYLATAHTNLIAISSLIIPNINESTVKTTAKFYEILLTASPEVIKKFTYAADESSEKTYRIIPKVLDFKHHESNEQNASDMIDLHLKRMDSLNEEMKEYNEKEKNNPELFQMYDKEFKNTCANFEKESQIRDLAAKNKLILQIEIMKEGIEGSVELADSIYSCIFHMRKDLERELTDAEMSEINSSIEKMLENISKNTNSLAEALDKKLEEMS